MSITARMDWQKLLNPNRRRKSRIDQDHRVEFERDYDRTIFSTPVKRLQDKAQVFPLERNDSIRTRLTHSLEVGAVARGLATKAGSWLIEQNEIRPEQQRWIEAIASTCGLIHDLGNPPFGHAGEDVIREWFLRNNLPDPSILSHQQIQDFRNFEGNAQTLRIVAKLQILADFYGLNLTYGTLSASCKYTAASHHTDPTHQSLKKPGHFASENDVVDEIRHATGTENARNPITYLVEAADDIVYSVADIEDAVKKGVLQWVALEEQFRQVANSTSSPAQLAMESILKVKANILGGASASMKSFPEDSHASAFRTAAIGFMVPQVIEAFKASYEDIMWGRHRTELVACSGTKDLVKLLKNVGKEFIYPNHSTLKLELMGRKIIGDLMAVFWEGAESLPIQSPPTTKDFKGRIGALLSRNYREVFQQACASGPLPEAYLRHQLVTDYVCGMTDSFALNLHRELFNG